MRQEPRSVVLLVGFEEDIQGLASLLSATTADFVLLTESATETNIPEAADIVVYAMSEDTGFSSQLHSVFVCVHDRILTNEEYLVAVGNVDLNRASFPELSRLPQASIGEIQQRLNIPRTLG
jgi:hypothetical protein